MNLHFERLFNVSVTKGVHSVPLFLLISLYFLRVEATSTSGSLEECKKSYHDISSIDDYANFMKLLNGVKLEESFHLTFLCFKNGTELLRFLGWSDKCLDEEKQCEESPNDQNLNGCKLSLQGLLVKICTQPSATSSDLSDDSSSILKRAFVNLKFFHFHSDGISNDLICEIVQSLPNENIAQFMKAICKKFFPESQVYVLKRIRALFPNSKLAQCSEQFTPELIDEMFSEYQKSLNCSSDNEIEIKVLKSMVTSLFFEKLSNEFIKTLPTSLKSLYVYFYTEFPILIDFSQSLKDLTTVDTSLFGSYFDYSSSDLIKFLSTSRIPSLRLINSNLTSNFFTFLEDNLQTDSLTPGMGDSKPLNTVNFKNVMFLSLQISNHTFYEKLKYLKNLSSLSIFLPEDSLSCLIIALRELKQIINLTNINTIHMSILTNYWFDNIDIKRNPNTGIFEDKDFDIESKIVPKINECQMKIAKLNPGKVQIEINELKTTSNSTSLSGISSNYEDGDYESLSKQLSQLKITLILQCTFNIFDSISLKNCQSDNEDFNVKSFIIEIEREFYLHVNSSKPYDILDNLMNIFIEIRSKLISDDDKNKDRKLEILNQIIVGVDVKYSELSKIYSLTYRSLEIQVD